MSLKSLLLFDISKLFTKEEVKPVLPIIPLGITRDEFDDLDALCKAWLYVEQTLVHNEGKEVIRDSAYYNIASFNICKLEDVPKVFKHAHSQYTINRLMQLYLNICVRFGRRRVLSWSTELQETIISLGQNKQMTEAMFKEHPYLVLVPTLNRVLSLNSTVRV